MPVSVLITGASPWSGWPLTPTHKFSKCRERETGIPALNGTFMSYFLNSALRELRGRGGGKIVRVRGSGWLQGNSAFWTQLGNYVYEIHISCDTNYEVWASDRQNPSMERGGGNPTSSCGASENWWFLGEQKSVIFKSIVLCKAPQLW